MPQDRTLEFKPQGTYEVNPPILDRILEQYKYFRGIELDGSTDNPHFYFNLYANFGTDGELQRISGIMGELNASSMLVLFPQRTPDGFIFSFLAEQEAVQITPRYSSSTGRIVELILNQYNGAFAYMFRNYFKSSKILYASSAEVISQYLIDDKKK